jgi:hypothetical protein
MVKPSLGWSYAADRTVDVWSLDLGLLVIGRNRTNLEALRSPGMPARRMLLLVAILMGITAIVAGFAAPVSRTPAGPAPEAVPAVPAQRAAAPVEETVSVAAPRTVAVGEGDLVRLTVTGQVSDVVELVGLDLLEPIAPETPAVFDVHADRAGRYPIRLTDDERDVGALKVTPGRE